MLEVRRRWRGMIQTYKIMITEKDDIDPNNFCGFNQHLYDTRGPFQFVNVEGPINEVLAQYRLHTRIHTIQTRKDKLTDWQQM